MMTLLPLKNLQLFLCHCGGVNCLYNMELLSLYILWAVDVCQISVPSASEEERQGCFEKTSCVWSLSSKQMTKTADTWVPPVCLRL